MLSVFSVSPLFKSINLGINGLTSSEFWWEEGVLLTASYSVHISRSVGVTPACEHDVCLWARCLQKLSTDWSMALGDFWVTSPNPAYFLLSLTSLKGPFWGVVQHSSEQPISSLHATPTSIKLIPWQRSVLYWAHVTLIFLIVHSNSILYFRLFKWICAPWLGACHDLLDVCQGKFQWAIYLSLVQVQVWLSFIHIHSI